MVNILMIMLMSGVRQVSLSFLLVFGGLLSASLSVDAVELNGLNVLYYRYVDENGVRSTGSSIPPKYAQKGYEIVTRSGKVVKVPAAPDPKDVEKAEMLLAQQRKETAEYEVLARRYSSVYDIYSARDRRLTHLNASISILKSNIENIKKQVEGLTSKAANSERAGRNVSQKILNSLKETRAELKITETKLRMRTLEHDEIHRRFEEDVKLFERGKAFFDARRMDSAR